MTSEYICEVKTAFNKDRIESWLEFKGEYGIGHDIINHHNKQIINLRDQGIREALIKLGWTPPKEENVE